MSFENFPEGTEQKQTVIQKKNNTTPILIGGLLVALLATWGYIIWDKNQTNQKTQTLTTQITTSDSSKNELQSELNDATMRLDMLKTTNSRADSLIKTKDKDIEGLKVKIQTILNNKNATASELADARRMISQLKSNIDSYTAEIEKLQGEKIRLTEEKRVVTEERDIVTKDYDSAKTVIKDKEDVIDVGSTLQAFNFKIIGVQERKNKEKETSTAKRVDKLRISFDLENRIATSGAKDVFVSITAPDGTPVAVEALGSGKFVTREGIERLFTKKVQVNYNQGEKQTVTVEWSRTVIFKQAIIKLRFTIMVLKLAKGYATSKKADYLDNINFPY